MRKSALRLEPLGIVRLEALTYYAHDLARVETFLKQTLDFAEVARSSEELNLRGRQQGVVFEAGAARLLVCAPKGEGGRAWRYLRKHPEGVGTLTFSVQDIQRAFDLLEQRGGTLLGDIQHFEDAGGKLSMFSLVTPFGDTTFRFVQRDGYQTLFPGPAARPRTRGG